MADKPVDKTTIPLLLEQNPSSLTATGQARVLVKRQQVDRIMEVFLQMLPSNYVSLVTGPFYTVQFQAVAEVIADLQINAQEVFADSDYDYMRPEFLFQMLGSMVFPDATTDGYPTLKGDLTYREFMKRMVALLLQGATRTTVEQGLALLSEEVTWTVIEKALAARTLKKRVWNKTTGQWEEKPGSAWGLKDQFEFEINVSDPIRGFPEDPFVLQENVRIVLRALKPAHTLYEYRHLFVEAFGGLFDDTVSWDSQNYHYEDFRKFCCGAKELSGTAGVTWTDRTLFSDTTRDFWQIRAGADLTVTSGPNSIHTGGIEGTPASMDARHVGRYRVTDVRTFPVGTDMTPRAYTTSPTGLVGRAVVSGDDIEDSDPLGVLPDTLKVNFVGSVRFLSGAFFLRVGGVLYQPVGVLAFSPDPGGGYGVEYLLAISGSNPAGTLKFGTMLLQAHNGQTVTYVGDWGAVVEGETVTFTEGPNAGTYRLKMLLGTNGGPVGKVTGPATRVRVAQSLLRLDRRMRYATSGQGYTVVVDRLGVQVPHGEHEDATVYFLL